LTSSVNRYNPNSVDNQQQALSAIKSMSKNENYQAYNSSQVRIPKGYFSNEQNYNRTQSTTRTKQKGGPSMETRTSQHFEGPMLGQSQNVSKQQLLNNKKERPPSSSQLKAYEHFLNAQNSVT
jgi:hypothetical protein